MKRSITDQPILVPFKAVSDNFGDHPAEMSLHSFLNSCEQLMFYFKIGTHCFLSEFADVFFHDHFEELMKRGMRQVMDQARKSQEMFEQNLPEMIHSKAWQEAQRRVCEVYD